MLFFIGTIGVFLGTWFTVVALPGSRGEFFVGFLYALLGLFFASIVFGAIVPGIATATTGPDHLRWSKPIDGTVRTAYDNHDSPSYFFVSNGKPEKVETPPSNGAAFIIPTTGAQHWDYLCDETPDWSSPWTVGDCHNVLYVNTGS